MRIYCIVMLVFYFLSMIFHLVDLGTDALPRTTTGTAANAAIQVITKLALVVLMIWIIWG